MSDLQCAARVLFARHAESDYDDPDVVGDDGGWLTETGRHQALALAERLRGARVAGVRTSTMTRSVETGRLVAEALGLESAAVPGLQEFSVGDLAGAADADGVVESVFARWLDGDLDAACPGAESGRDVIARVCSAVEAVADDFRGETVLLVGHGGAMALAVPYLAGQPALSRRRWVPPCGVAEVDVDADGWALRSWPGSE